MKPPDLRGVSDQCYPIRNSMEIPIITFCHLRTSLQKDPTVQMDSDNTRPLLSGSLDEHPYWKPIISSFRRSESSEDFPILIVQSEITAVVGLIDSSVCWSVLTIHSFLQLSGFLTAIQELKIFGQFYAIKT